MRKRSAEECEEDGKRGGYQAVTDAASTYVLCPRLWNQVSVNFRCSEDNEDDGEQSNDVQVVEMSI